MINSQKVFVFYYMSKESEASNTTKLPVHVYCLNQTHQRKANGLIKSKQ